MRLLTERNLAIALIVGIVAGVLVGLIASMRDIPLLNQIIDQTQIFGKIFLSALRMIVVPLVLFSVTSGVANLRGTGQIGRRMIKTLVFFLATSFIAVLVGILFTNIIQPGVGMDSQALMDQMPAEAREAAQRTQQGIADKAPATLAAFIDVQINNILMNPFKSMAEMNLVGLVFFSLMLGMALASAGEKADAAIAFFSAIDDALMRLVKVVMWIAPLGVFALASKMLSTLGIDAIMPLAKYFITVVLGLSTQMLIVYPLILIFLCRYSPLRFFIGMRDAILLAVSSSSSAATMPVTLRVAQENLGVDERSANFVIPMGATINMNGTALYEAIAAMFIAQLIGIELTLMAQILVFLTATLAAIGAAGIPQAGLVTMVVVFNAIGIPLEWMALIIVVDRPLDHLRTIVNVAGDVVGAIYLSGSEKELDTQVNAG